MSKEIHYISCPSCYHGFRFNSSNSKILPNREKFQLTIKKDIYIDCDSQSCEISDGSIDFCRIFDTFKECLVAIQEYTLKNKISFSSFDCGSYRFIIERDPYGRGNEWYDVDTSSIKDYHYREYLLRDNFNKPGLFHTKFGNDSLKRIK